MISYSIISAAIAALTTTVVAANHHPTHSTTSRQTDFPTVSGHHPNLRTYQNTTSSTQAFGKGSSSSDDSCEDPEVLCGMTIPAGKTFNLEKDLVCTTATAGKGNTAVAITIEEGATLNCNGHHVTQLNDEVGKVVECTDDPVTVTGCGLAWGASGVELKSGARFENCRVSGWQYGLLIAPPADGYADEIKIDNCEVTLNRYGLYAFAQDELDVLDFSIENSYFHHNYDGIYASVLPSTSKVKMEDVKSNFNIFDGIRLTLDGSELTMDDMEASYNGNDGINLRAPTSATSAPLSTSAAKVILQGANSVIQNKADGFRGGRMDVVVSRGATLNAYNNTRYGVRMAASSSFTVKKGGKVNSCSSGDSDIYQGGPTGSNAFFPISGKHYTCDSVKDDDEFECENECPVCL